MSKIEWTDKTWNVVTGCTKVSQGCRSCYMYRQYPRLKRMGVNGYEHSPDVVSLQPGRLDDVRHWRKPRRVFVNSMSDTFHELVPDHYISWLFQAMMFGVSRGHLFMLLTKRPQRALRWWELHQEDHRNAEDEVEWPHGVLIGASVESQDVAEERLQPLSQIPAHFRFISAEPLLGPLDIEDYLGDVVNWVIVGGESGPRARPMDERWALDLLEVCDRKGVPAFLKQLGGKGDKRGAEKAVLDGRRWTAMPELTCAAQ